MGTPITGKLEAKALTATNFILNSLEHQCSIARTNAYPDCSVEDIRATAERLVACWNLCANLSDQELRENTDWTAAVQRQARPGDVTNLVLRSTVMATALMKIAAMEAPDSNDDTHDMLWDAVNIAGDVVDQLGLV